MLFILRFTCTGVLRKTKEFVIIFPEPSDLHLVLMIVNILLIYIIVVFFPSRELKEANLSKNKVS